MDYKSTLNLPKTDFPMKGNLPTGEPERIASWEKADLYGAMRRQAEGRPKFILHDGPPYANGDVHIGTALNKVLKDFVVKFKHLTGHDAPYVPGWDCHGLPIELKTMAENPGVKDPVEVRELCRKYAHRFIEKQKAEFVRLGVLGLWQRPYLTLDPRYEAFQLEVFADLVENELVERALKSIYWCPDCSTALADAEIEYQDKKSLSVFVQFQARPETLPASIAEAAGGKPVHFAIWTTTPWTLPGNVAIALHPEHTYGMYEHGDGYLVLAPALRESMGQRTGVALGEPSFTFPGRDAAGVLCRHPFLDRDSRVLVADYVSMEDGTGLVHIAPGHGQEDFQIGQQHDLPVISPIDAKGHLTDEAGPFAGMFYAKANKKIRQHMEDSGALLGSEEFSHSYAHCWRCKNPIIHRACPQWFIMVDRAGVRTRAIEAVNDVQWFPDVSIKRIGSMLETRPDWCISRQRVWGVPIPALHCKDCDKETLDPATIRHVAQQVRADGSSIWIDRPLDQLLPAGAACSHCGGKSLEREKDIMDVWFDSGVSHTAVLQDREELRWPADLYLEGSDQHRGWFQTSLLTSIGSRGSAPYRQVLTHGFVVDENGRKMSKSIGNTVEPKEINESLGADILRLWVASADYTVDIKCSKKILKQCTDMYRRIRNTLRFFLGNLDGFDPATGEVPAAEMTELDRWSLAVLIEAVDEVKEHYSSYRFYQVLHLLHNLCVVELSSFYMDVVKDRLYCSAPGSQPRRSAQTALYHWLRCLTAMLAPILSFTAEEAFEHTPGSGDRPASVFLSEWPQLPEEWRNPELLKRWERRLAVRKGASKALEIARAQKVIGSGLQARLNVRATDDDTRADLQQNRKLYEEICIVSALELVDQEAEVCPDSRIPEPVTLEALPGIQFGVQEAPGQKCQRCWKLRADVGKTEQHPGLCHRCVEVVSC